MLYNYLNKKKIDEYDFLEEISEGTRGMLFKWYPNKSGA